MKPRTAPASCSVMFLLTLAACGGGGGADPGPQQPTPGPSAAADDRKPEPPAPVVQAPAPAPSIPAATAPPPTTKPPENTTPPAPPTGGDPPPPGGPAPIAGSRIYGAWSSLVDWPLLAIHAALLPDGRVMTYGTNISRSGGNRFMYDVFDPRVELDSPLAHLTLENTTGTFLFCSAQMVLPGSGELLLTGGDVAIDGKVLNRGNADVNIFDPRDNELRPSATMQRPRWYASATVLPSGELYLQGGTDGEDHPEMRTSDGRFRLLEGINTLKLLPNGDRYFDNNYPRNFVAPNGKIFGLDHHWMYQIDPYATGEGGKQGALTIFDAHWDIPNTRGASAYRGWAATSTAVMYRPGKILQIGGTQANATIIDITGPTPSLKDLPPMNQVRQWANATVMPDGRVLVSGGSSNNLLRDPASKDVGQVAYMSEIFDPATENWSTAAPVAVGRFYHSLTLLLPDATILSAGGGSPGPLTNLNAQVYYPGYLFRDDGTRAARPVIDQSPGALPLVLRPSSTFEITSPDAAAIERVTLVGTGSVTHSFDMNQRFVEPSFSVQDRRIRVTLPSNAYETPPGYYMVFIINRAGTPSKARMVRIDPIG
jgi:hypothetical protein